MSKTGAAFSVRFLRNGDQVVVVRDIISRNGTGLALFQVVDPNSGTVAPSWDATGTSGAAQTAILDAQPIIRLGVRSSAGYPAEITGVTWAYDGVTLSFAPGGSGWVTAEGDARFQARVNGAYHELKVVGNLASKDAVANRQISYEVAYVSNAMTDRVQGSVDVLIQTAGSDSHILQITADRVELDAEHESATLTAVGMYGTEPVAIGSGGYALRWYQDGYELVGQTSATLTVTRAMVEGGSIFIARLHLDGNAVAQDSQRINDVADEYQVSATPTSAGSNYVGIGHDASYTLAVTRNGAPYSGAATFAWQIYNAAGEQKATGSGSAVTVTAAHALVGSGEGAYHADCDVQVTATFN